MIRTWHVFWREYWGHITRRSYLIFTFGFPAFIIIMPLLGGMILALAVASAIPPTDPRPVGLVDQVDLLGELADPTQEPVEIISFPTIQAAQTALTQEVLQAYYLIPTDYWQTGQVKIVYENPPTIEIDNFFKQWVNRRVRAKVPPDLLAQLDQTPQISHQTISGEPVFSLDDLVAALMIFLLAYFIQLGGSFTANYMYDSIASEAADRMIEIVITSISPLQFLTGKVIGLLGVGLTQLMTWGGVGAILILWGSAQLDIDLIGYLWGWDHLGILAGVLLATYVTNQLLAAAIGLLQMNSGSGPLFFNTLNWVAGIGFIYAITFVPRNPNTFLAVVASMFPLTAPIVLLARLVVTEVPTWQLLVGQIILWGTNVACLFWLRRLLKTNLVAYAPRLSVLRWLKGKVLAARAAG